MLRLVPWLLFIGPLAIVVVVAHGLITRPGPAHEGLHMCPEGGTMSINILRLGSRNVGIRPGAHTRLSYHSPVHVGPEVATFMRGANCLFAIGAHILVVDRDGRWFVADEDLARVDGWSAPRRLLDRVGTAPLHALVLAVLVIAPFVLLARRVRRRWLVGYAIAFAGLGWLALPFAALI